MGENEQSGMLRTVVVIGLVAIIAIVMIVGVVGLKSNINNSINEATPASMRMSLLTKSDFKFSTHVDNNKPGPVLGDNVVDWTSDIAHLDTTSVPAKTWVVGYSPEEDIPRGSKRVKFSVVLKGSGSQYVHPHLHLNTSAGVKDYYLETISASHPVNEFTTFSQVFDVPNGTGSFAATLESREGMNVWIKDMTVTFYDN